MTFNKITYCLMFFKLFKAQFYFRINSNAGPVDLGLQVQFL